MCYNGRSDPKPMNTRLAAVAIPLLLLAAGCTKIPDTYAPPVQRQPLTGQDPSGLRPFIRMNEPGVDAHLIKDVGPFLEGGTFRWTQQNPTLQFQLPPRTGWKLRFDFSLHSTVLKQTGPITITYFVNGKKLDEVRYEKDGEQHFEKAVPAGWLSSGSATVVAAKLDKVMEAADHNKLGLILTGAGFVE
jgi:hypothetical protein